MEWKWSKGEKYEKSLRRKQEPKNINNNLIAQNDIKMQSCAISNSLNYDEGTWELMNQFPKFVSRDELNGSTNKREELDAKVSNREMLQQCGNNPFMQNGNYITDIETSDQFLKPINTTCH